MIKRLRARRAQARDIALLDPDRAAQLCRTLTRAGVADRRTLILLAKRGQQSEPAGQPRPRWRSTRRRSRPVGASSSRCSRSTTSRPCGSPRTSSARSKKHYTKEKNNNDSNNLRRQSTTGRRADRALAVGRGTTHIVDQGDHHQGADRRQRPRDRVGLDLRSTTRPAGRHHRAGRVRALDRVRGQGEPR